MHILEDAYGELPEARDVIVMLRQPEWLWVETEDHNRLFFGTQNSLGFKVRGCYYTGALETEDIHIFREEVELEDWKSAKDPREYVRKATKRKVYRRNSQYFVVEVGRVVDLIHKGYEKSAIVLTSRIPAFVRNLFLPENTVDNGPYLKRFPGYVILSGPHDKEEAQEKKLAG